MQPTLPISPGSARRFALPPLAVGESWREPSP